MIFAPPLRLDISDVGARLSTTHGQALQNRRFVRVPPQACCRASVGPPAPCASAIGNSWRLACAVTAVASGVRRRWRRRVLRAQQHDVDATLLQTDHYSLLGLPRFTANDDMIREAYKNSVRLAENMPDADKLRNSLAIAFETLTIDERRSAYDVQLRDLQRSVAEAQLQEEVESLDIREGPPQGQSSGPAVEAHLPGRRKVHVKTFGCQHNQSDGEYMMGQLQGYGYELVDTIEGSDVCVVNSCTVKNPSESRGLHMVNIARNAGKKVVLAGCVPSGDKQLARKLKGVSMLHVTQIDRIVDVVEETIKGRTVTLLDKKPDGLPSLALPKVRQDALTEIIPINVGCLSSCTYCKTKHARGTVVSYPIDELVDRALQAASEGVRHIELASEDMGAYGVDIGTNIAELLLALSDALPPGVMLRTGMTNPPYIMDHLDGVVEALQRPNVYEFMHIPIQSGSDTVLRDMRRDYAVADFLRLVDKLRAAIPDIYLLTDVICGFPTETEDDWKATMDLVEKIRFRSVYSSRFFARAGTPAARMTPLDNKTTKRRHYELSTYMRSYDPNVQFLGRTERVWFAGTNTSEVQGEQTVGRTKSFAKVVVPRDDSLLGRSALVEIQSTCVQHVEGTVIGDVK